MHVLETHSVEIASLLLPPGYYPDVLCIVSPSLSFSLLLLFPPSLLFLLFLLLLSLYALSTSHHSFLHPFPHSPVSVCISHRVILGSLREPGSLASSPFTAAFCRSHCLQGANPTSSVLTQTSLPLIMLLARTGPIRV